MSLPSAPHIWTVIQRADLLFSRECVPIDPFEIEKAHQESREKGVHELRRQLCRGYLLPKRTQRERTIKMLERVSRLLLEHHRNVKGRPFGRKVVLFLLEKRSIIRYMMYHPVCYRYRLPYYRAVVHEVMCMTKLIYRMECALTDTVLEDVRLMFQNFVDYLIAFRSPKRELVVDAQNVYEMLRQEVQTHIAVNMPPLAMDGKTEQTRLTGEPLSARVQRIRQAIADHEFAMRTARLLEMEAAREQSTTTSTKKRPRDVQENKEEKTEERPLVHIHETKKRTHAGESFQEHFKRVCSVSTAFSLPQPNMTRPIS